MKCIIRMEEVAVHPKSRLRRGTWMQKKKIQLVALILQHDSKNEIENTRSAARETWPRVFWVFFFYLCEGSRPKAKECVCGSNREVCVRAPLWTSTQRSLRHAWMAQRPNKWLTRKKNIKNKDKGTNTEGAKPKNTKDVWREVVFLCWNQLCNPTNT